LKIARIRFTGVASRIVHSTPASLLERLRKPHDAEAWDRFVRLYSPLLVYWAKKFRLGDDDAADLVQEIFALLLETLPNFQYDPARRFRGWLWTVACNKYRERLRRKAPVPLQDGDDVVARSSSDDPDEQEYRQYISRRALELMQQQFQPNTWKACWETVVNGRDVAEVAAELGMTARAVYIARCRVLRRLRQELAGLFE
jgi:RNA polymerase sigma-70 factor (ECF subfamily)